MQIKVKIRLAILDCDRDYQKRLADAFRELYPDEIELYSFTEKNSALEAIRTTKIDFFLMNDNFGIDLDLLPPRCSFAYFLDAANIFEFNEQRAVSKYQKTEQIYKQILAIFSEQVDVKLDIPTGECAVIAFTSVGGGVGSSSEAAACAIHYATRGKRVLYLNLERFGSADMFFSGQGQFDMSDVIFAFRKGRANLPLKLESCVKQDKNGVFFYSAAKNALDMMELTADDTVLLINALKKGDKYDCIILDMDFGITKDKMQIFKQVQALILVGDGSAVSNLKTERAYYAIETMESDSRDSLVRRLYFIYNRVSSLHGITLNAPSLQVLGGSPRFSGGNSSQIVEQLAKQDLFDKLL